MAKSTTGSAKWLFVACKARTGDAMAKLVLIALADRANDNGVCWPSIATIASDCECGVTAVKSRLKYLEQHGFIERVTRTADGMKQTSEYRITLDSREATIDGRETTGGRSRGDHKTPNETPSSCIGAEAFEIFWEAYPRKTSKAQGKKAFHKAVKDEQTLEAILVNIQTRLAAGEWSKSRTKYIPHPATYLNNQRWLDEGVSDENPGNGNGPRDNTGKLSASGAVRARRELQRQRELAQ